MKTQNINSNRTVLATDSDYPTNLKYIYDPPEKLHIKGQIIPEDNIAIAVVGSRRASFYGLKSAEDLSFELAAKGITIVSGLARGIDSAAHRGALKAAGRTIAVLGSGINRIYPDENIELAEKIAGSGAVISEFADLAPPLRYNFPQRNRIISGLSLGVVVVEAAKRSGALITANFALEQGREVFALPGKIDSFTSRGTHELIKQGAKLVESCEDIIEELEPLKIALAGGGRKEDKPRKKKLTLPEKEGEIYSCLSTDPIHIDEIIEKVPLSYGQLLTALMKLQYKKLIKELPGKLYVRD